MSMKVKFILTYVAGIVTGIVLIFAVGLFPDFVTQKTFIL